MLRLPDFTVPVYYILYSMYCISAYQLLALAIMGVYFYYSFSTLIIFFESKITCLVTTLNLPLGPLIVKTNT